MKLGSQHCWFMFAWLVAVAVSRPSEAGDTRAVSTDPQSDRVATRAESANEKSTASAGTTTDAVKAATPQEIAAWVAELDDNRYLVRETATRRLMESGAASLPSLLAAANAGRPEPADRAVWVLKRLAGGKDNALRRQSLEQLVQLQNRPQIVAAAQQSLAQLRHDEAVAAIQRLGGLYVESDYGMEPNPYLAPRVVLDKEWRGGDAGLVHLQNLKQNQREVRQVIIIGTDITVAGLAELQRVNKLESLLLYGTKLEPEDVPAVQKMLPQVEVDYRRGGLLGVGSTTPDGMGPAIVGLLSKGGVAEAAGIQVNDIIQKFQGQPVPNFKTLTQMIGKHRGGEEVTLEVLRNGQPIEFKLKLGEWQTVN